MEELRDELDELISEEEDFREELPDSLSFSDINEQSEEISDNLEEAHSNLEDSIDALNSIL